MSSENKIELKQGDERIVINRLKKTGVDCSIKEFGKIIRLHNNFRGAISERIKMIIDGKDDDFYNNAPDYLKQIKGGS